MAKPKLTSEQKETLLTWLAADYDSRLITGWFKEREWPELSRATLSFYRKTYGIKIDEIRAKRLESALNKGLALKEERVKRLVEHADALEIIKWLPDERGRLWNEKSWRETLADIASEVGGRKQNVDITSGGKPIETKVDNERFDRAISTLADALRESLPGAGAKPDGNVGPTE